MIYVVSLSGGKDSVALRAWVTRQGLSPVRTVACNTGWEFDGVPGVQGWREYVKGLERYFGRITIVEADRLFVERTVAHKRFPSRVARWCTPELKIEPFTAEMRRPDEWWLASERECHVLVVDAHHLSDLARLVAKMQAAESRLGKVRR